MARSRTRPRRATAAPRQILRVKFFGIGELARVRGGYELRIYRDRREALALGTHVWTEGDMPMGGGCWNEWSPKDPETGEVTVSCGKAKDACPEGCEIWESVLDEDGMHWQRTHKKQVRTKDPGRFLCGCSNQK